MFSLYIPTVKKRYKNIILEMTDLKSVEIHGIQIIAGYINTPYMLKNISNILRTLLDFLMKVSPS